MGLFLGFLLWLLGGATGLAAESKPPWQIEWDTTVVAAEKEGLVSAYIFDSGPLTIETVQAFERAYPKIKINQLRGRGNDLGPRIVAERRAGKYLVDVFVGGKGTAYATLYIGKVLDPIKPLLVLPEVVDESKWWQGKHKYVDPEGKYIFAFIGNGGGVEINYNTQGVNPRSLALIGTSLTPSGKARSSLQIPGCAGWTIRCYFSITIPSSGRSSSKNCMAR